MSLEDGAESGVCCGPGQEREQRVHRVRPGLLSGWGRGKGGGALLRRGGGRCFGAGPVVHTASAAPEPGQAGLRTPRLSQSGSELERSRSQAHANLASK